MESGNVVEDEAPMLRCKEGLQKIMLKFEGIFFLIRVEGMSFGLSIVGGRLEIGEGGLLWKNHVRETFELKMHKLVRMGFELKKLFTYYSSYIKN